MFLYFNGCSYTYGKWCPDRENKIYSSLVSNHFGADHYNDSVCASSNDEIVERTLKWLKDNTCDHAIIMMTHDGRMKLNVRFMPHRTGTQEQIKLNDMFYRNFYNDELGATNFYRNRYILEQAFEKRNIPLLLMQYVPLPYQGTNIWKEMCKGDLPLVAKTMFRMSELSPKIKTILGRASNKEHYWNEECKQNSHPNPKGHRKIADFVIGKLTPTI